MRAKVLVELATVEHLHALAPAGERIKAACETLGTTGLYPWARAADGSLHARQFPYDAGYHEDPATGIAAAGLFYGLGAPAGGIDVFQGEAMGRPSLIRVRPNPGDNNCWVGGDVVVASNADRVGPRQ